MLPRIKPITDGFHTLTACLIVRGAEWRPSLLRQEA